MTQIYPSWIYFDDTFDIDTDSHDWLHVYCADDDNSNNRGVRFVDDQHTEYDCSMFVDDSDHRIAHITLSYDQMIAMGNAIIKTATEWKTGNQKKGLKGMWIVMEDQGGLVEEPDIYFDQALVERAIVVFNEAYRTEDPGYASLHILHFPQMTMELAQGQTYTYLVNKDDDEE